MPIEIIEHLISLFVGDHALVCAFHLIKEDDVYIGLRALSETGRDHQAIKEVRIALDVFEFVRRSGA